MSAPRVAVIGASNDRRKFGNKAVRAYRDSGFKVFPVNPNETEVEGLPAFPSVEAIPIDRLDRISVYVPPQVVLSLLDQWAGKPVGEVWLNPGSDAPEVVERAESLGLKLVRACSIVALGRDPARY